MWKNPPLTLTLLKQTYWLNYHQEVISLKKTLIPGMFSSVSDAELVTAMLDDADFNENLDTPDKDLDLDVEKDTNRLQN